jgi:hypothetical protein
MINDGHGSQRQLLALALLFFLAAVTVQAATNRPAGDLRSTNVVYNTNRLIGTAGEGPQTNVIQIPIGNLFSNRVHGGSNFFKGDGSAGPMWAVQRTAGAVAWQIDPDGHIYSKADNTYDIGGDTGWRPRRIIAAGYIRTYTGLYFNNTDAQLTCTGVGVLNVTDGSSSGSITFGTAATLQSAGALPTLGSRVGLRVVASGSTMGSLYAQMIFLNNTNGIRWGTLADSMSTSETNFHVGLRPWFGETNWLEIYRGLNHYTNDAQLGSLKLFNLRIHGNSTNFGNSVISGSVLAGGGTFNSLTVQETNGNGGFIVGSSGAALTNVTFVQTNLDFGSVNAQTHADIPVATITRTNAIVIVNAPAVSMPAGVTYAGWNSNNTIFVRLNNYSSTAKDAAIGKFYVKVEEFQGYE